MSHFDEEELQDIKAGPIAWMAAHPVAGNLAMIVMLIGGLFILYGSKKEVFPEFDIDAIIVKMEYLGASPEEVEQGIILPIEKAVRDIDNVKNVKSSAFEGYGQVIISLHNDHEIARISQDVKTAVDQINTFPVNAENLSVFIPSDKQKVMELTLYGSVSENVLRDIAENIQDRLERDPDIGIIELSNVRAHEVHIEIPQENLRRYGISIPDIADIIAITSLEIGGGSIKTSSGEILVRMAERRDYADDFKNIPIINSPNGATIYLGDIANIIDGFDNSNKYTKFNDKNAISLIVKTTEDQTPTGISNATKKILSEINNELPSDLKIVVTKDESILFQGRANLLIKNGVLGLILVVLFLALFLDIRLAFWVAMGIPISYMGAFLLLYTTDNFSINMVSMFAFIIALGIVVDDAIVIGENIYHKRSLGIKPLTASVNGAREMAVPVTISVLTNIVAFMPMLFMSGFMGKIFALVPVVVISIFVLSLIESLFILPAHLTLKQSKHVKNRMLLSLIKVQKSFNRKFDNFVTNKYIPFLKKSVSMRYISLCIFLFILITTGGYVAGGHLGLQLFPKIESDFAYAQATLEVGAPANEIQNIDKLLTNSANKIISENGGDKLSFGIQSQINENVITIRAFLTDINIRPISTKKFVDLWRESSSDITNVKSIKFKSNFGGPGEGAALTVELSHSDTNILHEAAIALASSLKDFSNTQDVSDGSAQGKSQFDFTVTDLGYTLGLTPADVGRQVRGAFYGSQALKQQRGKNEVRILVMSPKEERNSTYFVKNMMIKTPSGADVMLSDVVKMEEGRAYTTINRRDNRRVVTIEADVTPPSEANLIKNAIINDDLPKLQALYPSLDYSFEGEQAEMKDSLKSLGDGMIVVLFVMYAILAVLFSSYTQPLMIMIAIPFSMVGAVAGHFIMGFPLSIVSMFGIIALAGVVINDSLILIDLSNKKRKEGLDSFNAIIEAASLRVRPIILTTLTTFLGLAPMMFETSRQALFLVPMAISLGYGIVFATFLTLVLIPSLYIMNEDIKRGFSKLINFIIN